MSRLFFTTPYTDDFHKFFSNENPAEATDYRKYFIEKCLKYNTAISNAGNSFEELTKLEERLKAGQVYIETKVDLHFIDYCINRSLIEKIRQIKAALIEDILPRIPTDIDLNPFLNPHTEIPVLLNDKELKLFK